MMWKSVAAIPELLFVGKKATMVKDHPKRVNEYRKQKAKKMNKLTFANIQ